MVKSNLLCNACEQTRCRCPHCGPSSLRIRHCMISGQRKERHAIKITARSQLGSKHPKSLIAITFKLNTFWMIVFGTPDQNENAVVWRNSWTMHLYKWMSFHLTLFVKSSAHSSNTRWKEKERRTDHDDSAKNNGVRESAVVAAD